MKQLGWFAYHTVISLLNHRLLLCEVNNLWLNYMYMHGQTGTELVRSFDKKPIISDALAQARLYGTPSIAPTLSYIQA